MMVVIGMCKMFLLFYMSGVRLLMLLLMLLVLVLLFVLVFVFVFVLVLVLVLVSTNFFEGICHMWVICKHQKSNLVIGTSNKCPFYYTPGDQEGLLMLMLLLLALLSMLML